MGAENEVLTNRADIVEKAFVSSCQFSLSNDNQQINTCSLGRVFGLKHFLELDLTAYFSMCTQFVVLVCPHISVLSQDGIVGDYTVAGTDKAALCRCSNRNQLRMNLPPCS